jgi:hypothetical protein
MSWCINITNPSFRYKFQEEVFSAKVKFSESNFYEVPSGEYKAPDDTVLKSTFLAETEHGIFQCLVTSRRTGFNNYADIDEIEMPPLRPSRNS